jgi:hypothetical protein
MPKATTKSKNTNQTKPKSSFDIASDAFIKTGHFTLTNEILNSELYDFAEYLKKQPKPSSERDYKFYLENVTFNIEEPRHYSQTEAREYADEEVLYQLQEVFSFSPKWSVIALDNVTISQGENYYPLSSYFIYRFMNRIKVEKNDVIKLIITNALIITKAEFHVWAWMRLCTIPSLRLASLTLELLPHEANEDNFMVLCEALEHSVIQLLNLGNTEISMKGYRALNKLLDQNCFIEKLLLKEPTDPASRAIFKNNKDRLLYLDHEKFPGGRWPLCKLDINQLTEDETRTVGHWLLENALKNNDAFMVKCLIKAGANLLEQQGDEKPFLLQVFEKNKDFKLFILNHISYDPTFENTAKRVLRGYINSEEIIMNMRLSLTKYAETLRKRALFLLSDFEWLLTLFKTVALVSRPSQKRDQEFIEIYWRLFKCLILFRDARERVTVESISNIQTILNEIKVISTNAERGWNNESTLHDSIIKRLKLLMEDMGRIKKLIEKDNAPLEEPGPSARSYFRP